MSPLPTDNPIITISIPVYNREKLVCDAVRSALAQAGQDFEIVVIDNCSTDGTWEALRQFSDARLRLLRNERNIGLFGNFSRCFEVARGKYVRVLCSDDRLLPGCLAREAALLQANPTVALLSSPGWMINESGKRKHRIGHLMAPGLYPSSTAAIDILWILAKYANNPLNFPSGILVRRDAFAAAGAIDSSFHIAGDIDLWLRVLEHGDLAISDIPACEVMVHPGQQLHRTFAQHMMAEHLELARRWSRRLGEYGLQKPVMRHLAARAIYMGVRLGIRDSAVLGRHVALARQTGVRKLSAALAFAGFVKCRIAHRLRHTRLTLHEPMPLAQAVGTCCVVPPVQS